MLGNDRGRAVSRILSARLPTERIIYLLRPNPGPGSFPIAGRAVPWPPIWSCTRWGFPCRLTYARRGGLLPHLFTLTPAGAAAVCFLWHFPSTISFEIAARVYPGVVLGLRGIAPCGVRTFLPWHMRAKGDPPPFQGLGNCSRRRSCGQSAASVRIMSGV